MSDETKQCGTCGHAAHGNVGMGCTVEWESDGETFACGCTAAPDEDPWLNERDKVRAFHVATEQSVRATPTMPTEEEMAARLSLMWEELLELTEAMGFIAAIDNTRFSTGSLACGRLRFLSTHAPNLAAMAQENADIRVLTHGNDLVMGAPPEVFGEVMKANMAKVGPDGLVRRREDGKILKPENWQPPDVASALKKAGWKP